MHISCSQSDLTNAVNTVRRSIAVNSPVPALKGIYLKASGDSLTLESTDTELRISAAISAQVLEEGSILIPASVFGDFVRLLSDERVELKTIENDQVLQVNYTNSVVNLNCFDPEDYPLAIENEFKPMLSVSPDIFNESIKQVAFAASRDLARPILTGTLFDIKSQDLMTLVATDSHRLTRKDVAINGIEENLDRFSAIVPSRALNEVSRVISGNDVEEDVFIGLSDTGVFFKYGNTLIRSQLIDGQFPHYDEVIPKNIATTVYAETEDLSRSFNRAALIALAEAKGRGSGVVRQNIKDAVMGIRAQSNDVGEVEETVPIEKNGDDLEIAFNARYLLDVLKALDSERIIIEYSGPLSPALFKAEGREDYLYLVLPIRIS